jgi:phosphoheptose isomerase
MGAYELVNNAPVNSVPGNQSTPQDTSVVFSIPNGNAISVSDVDAGLNPVQITLGATNGTVTLGWPSGTATGVGSDIPVNTTTAGAQQNHTVVVADDGSYVVVWTGSKTGVDDDGGIFFQRFDSTGTAVGSETLVNIGSTTGVQTAPATGMDADGNFVITWQSADADGEGIFARRFDASGNPVGGEIAVNNVTVDEQTDPSIAVANDGSFVISWTGYAGSKTDVFARQFNSDGTAKGNQFTVNTTTAQDQNDSAVAIDDAGNFVVTWFDSGGKDIYARTFDASGAWITEFDFVVNSYTTDWQQRASVAMDADGNFVVTWQSWSQEGEANIPGVYARGFDVNGNETIVEFLVNETTAGYQWAPAISMDADGDFVITWQADPQIGDDNDGSGIYARQYEADGTPKTGETLVNTTTAGNQDNPSVGMNDRGDFVVAWNGPDADSDGIYARRFTGPTIPL